MSLRDYYLPMEEYRGFNIQFRVTEYNGAVHSVEAVSFVGMRCFSSNAKTHELVRQLHHSKIDKKIGVIEPEYVI